MFVDIILNLSLILTPSPCEINSIDLTDETHFSCLKNHRVVKNMKHHFRDSSPPHFYGKDKYEELFKRDFLVVGLLAFEQGKYSVILIFKNKPAMYAADLVPANHCSFRITNFEEVPVHPNGPEFMKKTVPELARSSRNWQNAFDGPDIDQNNDMCDPIASILLFNRTKS